MKNLKTVILAAGQGTRMKSKLPKVLHKILDRSLLDYVIDAAKEVDSDKICVVIGHKSEVVRKEINKSVEFVLQEKQLGTGHAVMQARDFIGKEGDVLILFGDTPLITKTTLEELVNHHHHNNNDVTVLSTIVDNPEGYGRIIRDNKNDFIKSVEHKDATEEEKLVCEINSGMYLYNAKILYEALLNLTNNNAQGEYYLPDTLKYILDKGHKVDAMITKQSLDILGVNSRVQLIQAQKIIQDRINEYWMNEGVTFVDPKQAYIGKDVIIEKDVIIYPNTFIEGNSYIGEDSEIGINTKIIDSKIGVSTKIEQSVVIESEIGNNSEIGPFAYIRPQSKIGNSVKIGDFVEVKKSTIGDGTKASHLTYIGDAVVGENVNFGCGTVIVNYDGKEKHQTKIEDNVFIGCNTNLISPVTIGENAYTAAGSTINKDVPPNSLGISRSRQENKENWVKRKRNN
ncbi:MAG: bifunctional UDP-N-acetylglucosamine diphosphorylase/glucosamine-1-phosphate N-acetyltransferase GlmU [Eubacteriales bacterium]